MKNTGKPDTARDVVTISDIRGVRFIAARWRESRFRRLLRGELGRMIFAISRSIMVSGTDLFANLEKPSLFFSLFRMLSATMFDAVPIGVAIPPMPVPTASAEAKEYYVLVSFRRKRGAFVTLDSHVPKLWHNGSIFPGSE